MEFQNSVKRGLNLGPKAHSLGPLGATKNPRGTVAPLCYSAAATATVTPKLQCTPPSIAAVQEEGGREKNRSGAVGQGEKRRKRGEEEERRTSRGNSAISCGSSRVTKCFPRYLMLIRCKFD